MADPEAVAAIHRAAGQGDVDGVARMLDEDPRLLLSERYETLLTRAAARGHVGTVRLLLERGLDVDTPDAVGTSALHIAASRGHEELVSLLLTSGADASMVGPMGWTALMNASAHGRAGVVRLLLRSMGARGLDVRDRGGCTALWLACFCGRADVVRALLLAGADHTIPSINGRTPPQIAQHLYHPPCVALIEVRKRPSIADASPQPFTSNSGYF
jgi:ankyrin repeat protein